MNAPLEGCRVLDTSIWLQGLTSMILGDLGAEVIKIEDRTTGDPARGLVSTVAAVTGVSGRNFLFEECNRNKKSMTLDLTKREGNDILHELVVKSDIFVQNFRKEVATKLGLDYATLSKYNPRLIYATSSGWGPSGLDKDRPSFDLTALARSGMMTIPGEPGMPPMDIQMGVADRMGALMTAHATVIALYMREKSGIGQEVEASLLGSMIYQLGTLVNFKLLSGVEFPKRVRARAGNPLFNHYKCKDGSWIVLGCPQSDRYWPSVCSILELRHLEKDPRFENMAARSNNSAELVAILDDIFITKTRSQWLNMFGKDGEVLVEPVNTISDVIKDPQVWANNYIVEFDHPNYGKDPMVGFPTYFSDASCSVRLPAPEFGQHTEEVLQNILGYGWEDITRLRNAEVI